MAKYYMIEEYKLDGQPRLGVLERAWESMDGIRCITLKIIDHYREGKEVYRTYHEDELRLLDILDDSK